MTSRSWSGLVAHSFTPAAVFVAAGLALAMPTLAQVVPTPAKGACPAGPGQPWVGELGITETVAEIMARQARTPARRGFVEADSDFTHHRDPSRIKPNPAAPAVPMWPWNFEGGNPAPVGERIWNPLGGGDLDNPQTIGTNVLAGSIGQTPGFVPPDSQGCVGPTQFVLIVNGLIRTFNKSTGLADGALSASTDVFFNSVRNGSGTSDPQVRFDRIANRWFLVMINTSTPNRVLVAVSSGPTITNTASFTFYFFSQDTVPPTAAGLADYPSLGVDANALYIGTNRFNGSFQGTDGFVVRKSSVTSGGPIVVTVFRNMGTGGSDGPYAPRGVDNPDPAATTGYFIGVGTTTFSTVYLRRISTPGGTPTISANLLVNVPTTVFPRTVAALGTTGTLDALDDRLFAAQIRRNRATGIDSIWTAHNIEVNTSGVGTTGGGRNGSRWYQINNFTTAPILAQAGTLFDSSASAISHWIPSVAVSGQGHMALGCSVASTTLQPGVRTAGRLFSDPLGTIESPTTIVNAGGGYNAQGSGNQRWGDYSAVTVDPNDDQTMWTFQEYCNSTNSWGVRATKLLAPPPCTPTSCNPSILNQGDTNVDVVVSGPGVSGSAYYDTDPTFSQRLSALVNGGGVTVNSVTYNPATPTQFTMNVTVDVAATASSRTVTATNPDGQGATSATGILSINQISTGCYANCDNSTAPPILNANDFQCFMNAFAVGSSYANCDGSTVDPVLNTNDFQCFLNAFAVGCT